MVVKMINETISKNLYTDSAEARVASNRNRRMAQDYGMVDLDMKSSLFLTSHGNQERVINRIGEELGINEKPSDTNLSFYRCISAEDDVNNYLFQGKDTDGNLYNINFTDGTYSAQSVNSFAKDSGLIVNGDQFYDIVDFGQDKAEFIDYAFEGTDDKFANTNDVSITDLGANTDWSRVKWVRQEVDFKTWGSSDTSQVATTSNEAFSNIIKHKDQWLSDLDKAELAQTKSETEYLQKIIEKAVKRLDETGKAWDKALSTTTKEPEKEEETKEEAKKEAETTINIYE